MLKNIVSQGNYQIWAEVSMLIFLAVFVAVIFWAFRKKNQNHFETMANVVMDGDNEKEDSHVR